MSSSTARLSANVRTGPFKPILGLKDKMIIKENTTSTVSFNPSPDPRPTSNSKLNIVYSVNDRTERTERNQSHVFASRVSSGVQNIMDEDVLSATEDENIIKSGSYQI